MRLLLLTPQLPYPPHQGTSLRNFNFIAQLAKRHQVCLLTFLESDQSLDDAGPLNSTAGADLDPLVVVSVLADSRAVVGAESDVARDGHTFSAATGVPA